MPQVWEWKKIPKVKAAISLLKKELQHAADLTFNPDWHSPAEAAIVAYCKMPHQALRSMRQKIETILHPVLSSGAMSIIKLIVLIHQPSFRLRQLISYINNTKFWELKSLMTNEKVIRTMQDADNFASTGSASVRNNKIVDTALRIALARILMSCANSKTGQQLITEHGLANKHSLVDPRLSQAMVATLEFEYVKAVIGLSRTTGPTLAVGVRGGPPDTRSVQEVIQGLDHGPTHPSFAITKRPQPSTINSSYKRARRGDHYCLHPIRLSRNVQETNALVLPPGDFGTHKPFSKITYYQDWKDNPSKSTLWQTGLQICLHHHVEVELKPICNALLWDEAFQPRSESRSQILPNMSEVRGHLATRIDSWNHHRAEAPAMFMHFERNKLEPRPLEHLHYGKWAGNLHYRDKVHVLDEQLYGPGDGGNVVYDYHQSRANYELHLGVNPPRSANHAFAEEVAPNYYEEERRTLLHGPSRSSGKDRGSDRTAALPLTHPDRTRYTAVRYGRTRLYQTVNMDMEAPHLKTEIEETSTQSNHSEPGITPCTTHWQGNMGPYPMTPQHNASDPANFAYKLMHYGPP